MTHYINCIKTSSCVIYKYHDRTIILENRSFSKLLKPEFYGGTFVEKRTPTDDIDVTLETYNSKSMEKIRDRLAKSLIFIHVWCYEYDVEIGDSYFSYVNFFDTILNFISLKEKDSEVRELACDLHKKLKPMYPCLNKFQGSFKEYVMETHYLVIWALFIILRNIS